MQSLDNVVVRFSSDSIKGEVIEGITTSVIFSDDSQLKSNIKECEAYKHNGKCNGCRACYSKDIKVIGYRAHGVKMNKVIKLMTIH